MSGSKDAPTINDQPCRVGRVRSALARRKWTLSEGRRAADRPSLGSLQHAEKKAWSNRRRNDSWSSGEHRPNPTGDFQPP